MYTYSWIPVPFQTQPVASFRAFYVMITTPSHSVTTQKDAVYQFSPNLKTVQEAGGDVIRIIIHHGVGGFQKTPKKKHENLPRWRCLILRLHQDGVGYTKMEWDLFESSC